MHSFKFFVFGFIAALAGIGFGIAIGQSPVPILGNAQVQISQEIPIVADLLVPTEDGETITATVPLTMSVNLQVSLSGATVTSVQAVVEPTPASTEVTTESPTTTPASNMTSIGEPVTTGNFEYTVLGVTDKGQSLKAQNMFAEDTTTTGKYIEVLVDVHNIGTDSNTFQRVGGLVDSAGRKFDAIDSGPMYVPEEYSCTLMDKIQPTFTKTCALVFEVASDSSGFSIIFVDQEFMSEGDEVMVNLGE